MQGRLAKKEQDSQNFLLVSSALQKPSVIDDRSDSDEELSLKGH